MSAQAIDPECTQQPTGGVNDVRKVVQLGWSGYGYAETQDGSKIYDLLMKDYFEFWDVEDHAFRGYFVCQACYEKNKQHYAVCEQWTEVFQLDESRVNNLKIARLTGEISDILERRDALNKSLRALRKELRSAKKKGGHE